MFGVNFTLFHIFCHSQASNGTTLFILNLDLMFWCWCPPLTNGFPLQPIYDRCYLHMDRPNRTFLNCMYFTFLGSERYWNLAPLYLPALGGPWLSLTLLTKIARSTTQFEYTQSLSYQAMILCTLSFKWIQAVESTIHKWWSVTKSWLTNAW